MSENKTFAERIADAGRATEMLDALPWEAVGAAITRDWAAASEPTMRDNLWYELQAIKRLRSRLAQTIQDGKAAAQAQEIASRPTPAQRRAASRAQYASNLGVEL